MQISYYKSLPGINVNPSHFVERRISVPSDLWLPIFLPSPDLPGSQQMSLPYLRVGNKTIKIYGVVITLRFCSFSSTFQMPILYTWANSLALPFKGIDTFLFFCQVIYLTTKLSYFRYNIEKKKIFLKPILNVDMVQPT